MRKRLMLLIAVLVLAAAAVMFLTQPRISVKLPEGADPQQEFAVVVNEYAPADWNHGYGHYDLSIGSAQGFVCVFGGEQVECRSITLSYGPTTGDDSPARVNLYVNEREDHVPSRRLEVYDGLHIEDFGAFVRWFSQKFAKFDGSNSDSYRFLVREGDFAVYSISDKCNCASAALYILDALPGVHDEARNPCCDTIPKLEEYFAEKDFL